MFDFYQYKAAKNLSGQKDLGTEFDYGFLYRFSGLVTIKGTMGSFNPGQAFDNTDATNLTPTKQTAKTGNLELEMKF
jgi:hypothetical protein